MNHVIIRTPDPQFSSERWSIRKLNSSGVESVKTPMFGSLGLGILTQHLLAKLNRPTITKELDMEATAVGNCSTCHTKY
jgi:hypothetical protein